jgi:hypothetical protein
MKATDSSIVALLNTAYHHVISETNIESGYQRFREINTGEIDLGEFCDAVAACLREGLIREPVRLPEGALQCHWHLELTTAGVAAARALVVAGEGWPPTSFVAPCKEAVDGRDKPGHDG